MALEAIAAADEPASGMVGDRQPGNATNGAEAADLRLGIVGAGKLGTTLARAAIEAGYDVAISGSGPADDISLTVDVLAPGARALTTEKAVRHADIIALAVPAHRFRELSPDLFSGKILIDAMNYWEPVDDADEDLAAAPNGTSIVGITSQARVWSRASTNSAITSSRKPGARRTRPTASRSARRAMTASRSAPLCDSSTDSASTLSTPDHSKMV